MYCLVGREGAEGRERCLWLRCCPRTMDRVDTFDTCCADQRGEDKNAEFYGVPTDAIEEGKAAGKIVAMKVDVEAAASLRAKDEYTGRKAVPIFVYIAPPSLEEARQRFQEK